MHRRIPLADRSRREGRTVAAAALVLGLSATAHGAAGFDFDTAPGRLPKTIVPLDYTIKVTPDIGQRRFAGEETVTLRFRAAGSTIVFNTLGLTVHDVRLDGAPVAKVDTDEKAQLTTVTLAASAAAGGHTLSLSYEGVIGSDPQGFFAQPYAAADGAQGLLLSTEMEPADARRFFPCWDEPAFRATYQLTAVLPATWTALSNMPVALRVVQGPVATTTFKRSPRMPSYLVDLNAGELRGIEGTQDGVRLGVWAVRGHEAEGTAALANAKQILADYNTYFGYRFPLPKLDSIAIPGGFSGAMENWGAITYTAQALLLDSSSSVDDEAEVFSTQAHEMAHQWNGDLVTMGWWDDLWLNESFASWRAAKETDLRHPEWKWWEAQDQGKESAMVADSKASSEPIQHHVASELAAGTAFDPVITYDKGQAVLRMLEAHLGAAAFRDGVRAYLKARAFSNATALDLWSHLSARSHRDVSALAADWIGQAGFPLVAVTASCDAAGQRTISLTQHRFLVSGGEAAGRRAHWQVPLQIRAGASAPRAVLFTQDGQTLSAGGCREPLSINADAIGFFRVQYDPATLALNTRAFGSLPDADRIALLDDQWALADAGQAPLAAFLALAARMGDSVDARAWEQISTALRSIERFERGTPGHEAFVAYARSILKPAADRLGWDPGPGETPAVKSLRRTLIVDLGAWGDAAILAEARRRFAAFEHGTAIAPDDQDMVLSLVGTYADADTFARLHALARQAQTDTARERLYIALAHVSDPQLAQQVAEIATGSEVPPQILTVRSSMIRTLHERHPQLAWSSFSAHAKELLAPAGALAPLFLAQYVPQTFWDSLPQDQLEAWLKAHTPAELSDNVARGMESTRFKLKEKSTLVAAADAYLAEGRSPQ